MIAFYCRVSKVTRPVMKLCKNHIEFANKYADLHGFDEIIFLVSFDGSLDNHAFKITPRFTPISRSICRTVNPTSFMFYKF